MYKYRETFANLRENVADLKKLYHQHICEMAMRLEKQEKRRKLLYSLKIIRSKDEMIKQLKNGMQN